MTDKTYQVHLGAMCIKNTSNQQVALEKYWQTCTNNPGKSVFFTSCTVLSMNEAAKAALDKQRDTA